MHKQLISFALGSLISCSVLAAKLPPSYTAHYTFESAKAPGTIDKVLEIKGGQYSLSSVLKASKFIFSNTITRKATGTIADDKVIAKTMYFHDEAKNKTENVTQQDGQVDALSAILILRIALLNHQPIPTIILNKNGNVVTQHFTEGEGKTISTPLGKVNATVLSSQESEGNSITYSFDPAHDYVMVKTLITKNGETKIDATIQSYTPST